MILAIDLGTSGPKVALVSIEGKILSSFFSPTTLIHTDDRGIEQDPNQWWQAIDEAVYNVFKNNSTLKNSILGIACTAQWSGTVALGHDGKPLMNAIIWMDARGKDSIKKINRFYPKISGYNLKNLYQWISKTGGAPGLSGKDSLAHILFIKENMSELYNRTYKFLEPKDYINFLLTGEIATSFDTMALHWITDNRDINAIRYDKSLLSIVGLEEEKFPSLLPSTQVLATLKKDLALRWNLPPQTPVMVGSPDVHTAAIGSGAIHDYEGHLCLGTSSWISCHVPFKKTSLTTNIASLPSALPGRYLVANEQQCASACLSFLQKLFLRDNFSKDLSYQSFETLAGQSQPGSQSLIFTPWINGERTPVDNHSVRGGFHNIYLKHGLEDFIRATYEGVSYNCKWLLTSVEKFIGRDFSYLHLIGGGALSKIWSQILADILERPIKQVSFPRFANARGAAWIAAITLGHITSQDIEHLNIFDEIYLPQKKDQKIYTQLYREFLSIYTQNKSIYQRLNL